MDTNKTLLFALFATAYSLSTFLQPYPFSWLVKILPILILIVISLFEQKTLSDRLFLSGLVFSLLGDFFLGYDSINWFIFGLGSFLIAHLCYLFCLWPIEKKHIVTIISYFVYGLAMFNVIAPGLGKLFIPVLMYMSVLLLMACFTLVSKKSNNWLVIGGLAFVASDSLLGVNKFYADIAYSHFLIIISYYFAQYSLVRGIFPKKVI